VCKERDLKPDFQTIESPVLSGALVLLVKDETITFLLISLCHGHHNKSMKPMSLYRT
jgi:hypothetical protein